MESLNTLYPLTLINTLSNKKEHFTPNNDTTNRVKMYVCGITPYDYAHLGHGRCYVTFDILYRLLKFLGYEVSYCRNFTDIDDKTIKKAEAECNDPFQYKKISEKFIKSYLEDMEKLNCLNPEHQPLVTEHIPEIIKFIEGLIHNKKAYATSAGDVYFSIDSFKDYGKLSKRDTSELIAGCRVEVKENKINPLDFALWKAETKSGPGWDSPWGYGRPGWHIECSALAKRYLGNTIDIHGGGMDLIFPHHENEVAQSEGLHNQIFARFWLHNAFVLVDQEKMSKSLGNFVTLKQILEKYNPMVIRYYYLLHHYRNPMEFSTEDILGAEKSYHKIVNLFQGIDEISFENLDPKKHELANVLIKALTDDLNIAKFFGIIFENIKTVENDTEQLSLIKKIITDILGLNLVLIEKNKIQITSEIQQLIDQREEARKAKDWNKSDEIRDKLKMLGYEIQDKKL